MRLLQKRIVTLPMRIAATMITCPARDEMLKQTLESLNQSDWNGGLQLFRDTESGSSERTRIYTRRALNWFMTDTDADFLLFLEDDIIFNVYLRWNLDHWSPIVENKLVIGTLYSPRQAKEQNYGSGWVERGIDYNMGRGPQYGAQAFVISRAGVELILRGWDTAGTPEHPPDRCPSDFKMMLPVVGAGHPVYYHNPSLVQHVGTDSIWNPGMPFHKAWDFEPQWKAHR